MFKRGRWQHNKQGGSKSAIPRLSKTYAVRVGRAALALLCHEFDLSAGHVRLVTEHEEKSVHGRASQRGKDFWQRRRIIVP
jgi:hypothetical protein